MFERILNTFLQCLKKYYEGLSGGDTLKRKIGQKQPPEVFYKKGNIHRKTPVLETLFK